MASRQQLKEDRAEAAAKVAAKDIGDINRAKERDEGYDLHSEANFKQARAEAAAKLAAKDLEDVNRLRDSTWKEENNKGGVIGSMFKAAKEAVVGKPEQTDRGDNSVGQKAGDQYTDYATQKAKESKEYVADKAKDAKDVTAEKAKEGKDSAKGKLGELKDRAVGFFTAQPKENVSGETETRRGMQEVKVQDKDYGTGRGGEKLVIKMEESRPGAVADALRAADKALGGEMEEEGVLHVERRREKM